MVLDVVHVEPPMAVKYAGLLGALKTCQYVEMMRTKKFAEDVLQLLYPFTHLHHSTIEVMAGHSHRYPLPISCWLYSMPLDWT